MSAKRPIAIIGAGLGRLSHAKGLKKQGKDIVLLEKARRTPRHSHGITVQPWVCQRLSALTDLEELALRRELAVDRPKAQMGSLRPERTPPNQFLGPLRANRGRLETLLSGGLPELRWEHEATGIRLVSADDIEIELRDSRTVSASKVVAADGVHSSLRKLMLPDADPQVLPYVVFNGKRKVNPETFEHTYFHHLRGASVIETRLRSLLLRIAVNDVLDDGSVILSYTFSRPATENDALHKPDRSHADVS